MAEVIFAVYGIMGMTLAATVGLLSWAAKDGERQRQAEQQAR